MRSEPTVDGLRRLRQQRKKRKLIHDTVIERRWLKEHNEWIPVTKRSKILQGPRNVIEDFDSKNIRALDVQFLAKLFGHACSSLRDSHTRRPHRARTVIHRQSRSAAPQMANTSNPISVLEGRGVPQAPASSRSSHPQRHRRARTCGSSAAGAPPVSLLRDRLQDAASSIATHYPHSASRDKRTASDGASTCHPMTRDKVRPEARSMRTR